MIKIGMIGAGGYAFELIKRIWQIQEKIQLIGVSSNPVRKSAGRDACIEKGVPVYSNPDELLYKLQGNADAIFVPTPINTHFELTKKCMDNGFDVFLEKPPVATIQELDALSAYATKRNKRVAVAFQCLYTTIVKEIKNRICSGEFGRLLHIRAIAGYPRLDSYYSRNSWAGKMKENSNWVLDGTINNPLAHVLANELYFASKVAGSLSKPVSIEAELYHGHEIESEDTSSVRILTEDNVEITLNASLCTESIIRVCNVIQCENAQIRFVDYDFAEIEFSDGKKYCIQDKSEQRIYMLERLAYCLESGEEFDVTLSTCRPFTIAINGAFDSCGCPKALPADYISRFEQDESFKTVIKGIDGIIRQADSCRKSFSEIGVPWAIQSKKIDLRNYNSFPSVLAHEGQVMEYV